MKRVRYEEAAGEESINNNMAKALILLSEANKSEQSKITSNKEDDDHQYNRVFRCKTCNRKFSSFQALGGHSASHKKPKLSLDGNNQASIMDTKAKTHECCICGVEFAMGQALGGHMRRHRGATTNEVCLAVNKDTGVGKKVMLFGFVLATVV